MTAQSQLTAIYNRALKLLARREHSEQELKLKLNAREFGPTDVEQAIRKLQRDGLQSDERFTEAYVNQRFNAGVGPLKIRFELRQKGICDHLAGVYLDSLAGQWDALMAVQRIKRYGHSIPEDYREQMKQARFLQNRGFSPESVMRLFR